MSARLEHVAYRLVYDAMNLRRLPSLPHWLLPSARLRVRLTYLWRHGRLPNLGNPTRFTELIQRRKLLDRDPRMGLYVNKVTAKAAAARLFGENWIIPTIWTGNSLPENPDWTFPFILKASHGCNQNAVCYDASDYQIARRRASKWADKPYGLWLDEWAYRDIPRGFIVEPFLGNRAALPVDYKIYVFGGVAAFIQVHVDRVKNHRWVLYDRRWNQISKFDEAPVTAPTSLDRMVANAERIASPFDFARVDFYEIDGMPKFGEVTFYPGSGLDRFDPEELDALIGSRWAEALNTRPCQADVPSYQAAAM
ncbi:ATP-grasp fold amidoligase family protein [Erythrobacter sp. R86502]|uniref:ATP-grasp fold amidoligase family protein n=1 Tax=Erythrobacter sp. R86502 TaxID=3093846 RepID=UPI0036D28E7F